MARIKNPFTLQSMVIIVLVAVAGLYLYSQFRGDVECTQEDIDNEVHGCVAGGSYTGFVIPGDKTDQIGLFLMKIILVGAGLIIGVSVATNVALGHMNKKMFITLIILGIVVFVVWKYIASPIFNAQSLDTIAFHPAMKLGLIK